MPRLKVCGVTGADFAVEAARRGVDFLGLIFAEKSPRRVTPEGAREIVRAVRAASEHPPKFVGVFDAQDIAGILSTVAFDGLDVIQLHGTYPDSDVETIKAKGYETWRLFTDDAGSVSEDPPEDAVLLDGRKGNESGMADWSLVKILKGAGRRVVLAGGISPANIAAAMQTGADIVDVSSSLETSLGMKSIRLLDELLDAAAKISGNFFPTGSPKCDIICANEQS